MVQGKWFAPGQDLSVLKAFRETDEFDPMSWNAVIYSNDVPCAAGRIRYHEGDFLLENIAVLPEHRHQGHGDVLVRLLLFKAQQHAATAVRLACQDTTKPFFMKYGFREDPDGSLLLLGKDICLAHCQGCGRCGK